MPQRDGPSCPGCGLPNWSGLCPYCRGDQDDYERELVPPFPTSRPDEESAALRSGAQGEDELAALVVHMWLSKEQRGPMYTESGDFYADFRRAYELAAARTNGGSDG